MKHLSPALLLALAVALAACDLGASTPSAEPLPSIGGSSADASMDPSTDASAGTAACEDAVAALDVSGLTSLDAASVALDETIASCETVADWEAQVGAAVPLLDLETAQTFLAARCVANTTLAGTPICEEVAM
jgi:hypothetical protein